MKVMAGWADRREAGRGHRWGEVEQSPQDLKGVEQVAIIVRGRTEEVSLDLQTEVIGLAGGADAAVKRQLEPPMQDQLGRFPGNQAVDSVQGQVAVSGVTPDPAFAEFEGHKHPPVGEKEMKHELAVITGPQELGLGLQVNGVAAGQAPFDTFHLAVVVTAALVMGFGPGAYKPGLAAQFAVDRIESHQLGVDFFYLNYCHLAFLPFGY